MCDILVLIDVVTKEVPMPGGSWFQVPPSAARLTGSLRDIGYDFPTAVADIVDNSIAAGATHIDIKVEFDGADSRVFIVDNGRGMSSNALLEALRLGSRRDYNDGDLGRYGLGLKTASLSQCRSLTVITRNSPNAVRTCARSLDLEIVEEWDEWVILDPGADADVARARKWLAESTGTVVLWRNLDRVLPEHRPEGGWAKRRLESLAARTAGHLGMVFHRFIEGAATGQQLILSVNGEKVRAWNPFAPDESARQELPPQSFEITLGTAGGHVGLRRYVLPSRDAFSSPTEFDRHSGPLNWNRQQGLYIYRADRLVQWGGWGGIRGIDEHTKLARAAIDFGTRLDTAFNINVAKMRVSIPAQLRQMLEAPVNELCVYANDAYRKSPRTSGSSGSSGSSRPVPPDLGRAPEVRAAMHAANNAGLALRAAAMQAGEWAAWQRITAVLQEQAPDVLQTLGLDT